MSKKDQPRQSDKQKSDKRNVKRKDNIPQKPQVVRYDQMIKIQEGIEGGLPKNDQKLKKIMMYLPDREEGQIVSNQDQESQNEDEEESLQDEQCDAPQLEDAYLKREPSTANDEKQSKSASPHPQDNNKKAKEEDSKQEDDCEDGEEVEEEDQENEESEESEDSQEDGDASEGGSEESEEKDEYDENYSQSDAKLEEPSEEYLYLRENQLEKIEELQANICLKLEQEQYQMSESSQVKLEDMDQENTSFSQRNQQTPVLTGAQLAYQFIVCPCGKLQAGPLHYILHIQQEHKEEDINEILMKRLVFYDGADFDELQKQLIEQQTKEAQKAKETATETEKAKEEQYSSNDDSLESEIMSDYTDEEQDSQNMQMADIDHMLHYQLEEIATNYQEGSLTMDIKKLGRITAQLTSWSLFVQDFFSWASSGTIKMKFVLTDFFIYLLTYIKLQKMKFSPAQFLRNKNSFNLLYDKINLEMKLGINIQSFDIERICNVLARWFYEYGFIRNKPIERVDEDAESDVEISYTSELDQREMIKRMERARRLEIQEETRSEPAYNTRLQ